MQRPLVLWLIFLVLMSCSGLGTQKRDSPQENLPSWANDPGEGCPELQYLCVVGEGSERKSAESHALDLLAQFFQSEVSSTSTISSLSSQSSSLNDKLSAQSEQEIETQIEVVTDRVVLKGVQWDKYAESGDQVFVLAKLSKNLARELVSEEISSLDSELKEIFKKDQRKDFQKAMELFRLREGLNMRHILLTKRPLASKIKLSHIHALKGETGPPEGPLFIDFQQGDQTPKFLGSALQKLKARAVEVFSGSDFKVLKNSSGPDVLLVRGHFKSEKLYLKVEQFVKYRFSLHFKSEEKNGRVRGAHTFDTVQVAKTKAHALELATQDLVKQMKTQDWIYHLNLFKGALSNKSSSSNQKVYL